MVESQDAENPKNPNKPKRVNYLKMAVIPDLKAITIDSIVVNNLDEKAIINTDASTSYTNFENYFAQHNASVVPPKEIGKVLPWVHIAISNAKSLFADMYHGVKPEFLQGYLNEYCYNFNRRKIPLDPFGRAISDYHLI